VLSLPSEGDCLDWLRRFHFSLSDLRKLVSRRTVILALMAVFLYQGVGIFYKGLALRIIRMRPASVSEVKAPAAASAVREPENAYRVIPERNLFGTTTNAVAQARTAPQQDITLLFDVKGTVAGAGKYGFAIIEEKGTRKQRLVKTGDVVYGAKVIRIKRNAVDILVAERERTLKIVETKEAPILPPPQGGTASIGPPPPPGSVVIPRSEVQEAMEDMGNMLSQAQIRPYFNAGVPDGFIVNSIRSGSLYQRMGIANGDIIQEVNNRKIQTADDVMGLLNTVKSGASLSLGIKRLGKSETLSYQFR
jgi:general secretion pathway protein C